MREFSLVLVASILIIVSGLILYFNHFNNSYAGSSNEWADFATFNGYFLSIANLIALGYITIIAHKTTMAFNRLQIRPLLFLTLDKPEQIKGQFKDSWFVQNGAKNAALNLIVRYQTERNSDSFTKWVSCTSLGENQKLELFWIHWADKIEICFSDMTNERFYKFEFMDYFGHTKEIEKQEHLSYLNEATNNRENNLMHLRDKLESYIINNKHPMKDYIADFIDKNLK